MLRGKKVDVFTGDSMHVCVIESGLGGSKPFAARCMHSGAVHCRFSAKTAKKLRSGTAINMELVE